MSDRILRVRGGKNGLVLVIAPWPSGVSIGHITGCAEAGSGERKPSRPVKTVS